VDALGVATDLAWANATLAVTAALLVAVALAFGRLAPETFRPADRGLTRAHRFPIVLPLRSAGGIEITHQEGREWRTRRP